MNNRNLTRIGPLACHGIIIFVFLTGCLRARSLRLPEEQPEFRGPPLESVALLSRFAERNVRPGKDFLNLYAMDRAFAEEIENWGLAEKVEIGEKPDVPVLIQVTVNPRQEGMALGAISSMFGVMVCYAVPTYIGSFQLDLTIRLSIHNEEVARYNYQGPEVTLWMWAALMGYEGPAYVEVPTAYAQNARIVARKLFADLEKDGHLETIADPALQGVGPVGGPDG